MTDAKDIESGVKRLSKSAQNIKLRLSYQRADFKVCFDAHIKAFKVTLELQDPYWQERSSVYTAVVFVSTAAMGLSNLGIESYLWNQFRGLLPDGVLTRVI